MQACLPTTDSNREDITTVAKTDSGTTTATTTQSAPSETSTVSVTLALDNVKVQRWFRTSRVESLKTLTSTEYGLLNEVLKAYPEYTIERVIREGTQYYAKRLMALANSADAKRTPRRKGVANNRIAKVYAKMEAANEKARAAGKPVKSLSASSLAVAAKTNIATAQRFLEERERNPPAEITAPVKALSKKAAAKKTTTVKRGRKALAE
jgi:hypothetical protein